MPNTPPSRSLLLIGTGLVGGSFALAAKAAGLFARVVGMDRNPESLRQAAALGVVDSVVEGDVGAAAVAAAKCEAACVAVPVGDIAGCVRAVAPHVGVVFDVGSVKQAVVDALGDPPANYVPCHPIAGSERAGPAAARADLFRGRAVSLTPVAATAKSATATVRHYWEQLGAEVVVESPAGHDERLALLSHLPHLVAFAFMEVAGRSGSLAGAGAGFRDFSRIAAADARVWADILHGNAAAVRPYLDDLIDALQSLAAAAEAGDATLRERLAAAAEARRTVDTPAP